MTVVEAARHEAQLVQLRVRRVRLQDELAMVELELDEVQQRATAEGCGPR